MSAKKSKGPKREGKPSAGQFQLISENRQARFRYEIVEELECGIMLVGSEVKSLRDGKVSLNEAYVRLINSELWLVGADIPEYRQAVFWGHLPKRHRKLLVHARQHAKLSRQIQEKGLSIVPLRLYFNARGLVKVVVGIGRGKKLHDKRETIKKADVQRQLSRELRGRSK